MHKKLHYLVVAGLIAITASGSLQLNAVVQNQEITAVWEDKGDSANGADPQEETGNPGVNDTATDGDNPTKEGGGTGTNATGEVKAVWRNSETYTDANGTTDNNGGPTITASKTKFLINKGDNFDLLTSLGLKVVDATDGDITSTVPKVDIPTTSTGSINKVLKVTNKKGITSELPIQINIIDVPKSITIKSESELENYAWGDKIGASNALTINVSDLADGKVTLTVSDKVNTLDYQVEVNVKNDDKNNTDTGKDNDNTGTDTDTDTGKDNDNTDNDNTDTDTDTGKDTDTDTGKDNDTDTDNDKDNGTDTDNDADTGKDNGNTGKPSGNPDNSDNNNSSTDDGTTGDNQTVVGGDSSGDGTTSLENTKTGAVAVGQIGIGLTGLLAMAIKRFRR